MLKSNNSKLRRGFEARIPVCSVLQREHHVGWLGERGSLDPAPIGYPRKNRPIQDAPRDPACDHRGLECLELPTPPIAKADISVAAATSLPARHRASDYTPYLRPRHPPFKPTPRPNTTNHELLHPSRILDARADWCVYKSIRQLPLDYSLRQPASDRGKCLRSQLIPQNRKEGTYERPEPRRSRQTTTCAHSSHRQSLRRNTNTSTR